MTTIWTYCQFPGGHHRGGGDKDQQKEQQVHGGGAQSCRGEGDDCLDFFDSLFGFLATLKKFHSLSSGGEGRQVCEGGEGEPDHLVQDQQEQEVNDCLRRNLSFTGHFLTV